MIDEDNNTIRKLRKLVAELELERQTGRTTRMIKRVLDAIQERQEEGETEFLILAHNNTGARLIFNRVEHMCEERDIPVLKGGQGWKIGRCCLRVYDVEPRGWSGFTYEDHYCLEVELRKLLERHERFLM